MSIQLDGHVTYPQEVEGGQAAAQAAASAGKPKGSSSISWEGWWHYSQKQSRGSNAPSSFKYFFVGPEIVGQSPLATASGTASTVAANEGAVGSLGGSGGGGDSTPTPKDKTESAETPKMGPTGGRNINNSGQKADKTKKGGVPTDAPAHAASNSGSSNSSTTPGAGTGEGLAAIAGSHPDTSLAQTISGGGSGKGARSPNNPPANPMSLYGPGGDGRLPTGTWSGQFAVKARGSEFMVTETFVLEFGSGKSPRTSPAPATASVSAVGATSTAGAVAAPAPTAAPPSPSCAASHSGDKPSTQMTATPTGSQSTRATDAAGTAAEATAATPTDVKVMAEGATEVAKQRGAEGQGATVATEAEDVGEAAAAAAVGAVRASGSAADGEGGGVESAATVADAPTTSTTVPAVTTTTSPASGPEASPLRVTTEPTAIPPVVRVSGWGKNRYGEFTLTGGHERATGRLDLTRFYYEKPKPPTTAHSSSPHSGRAAGGDGTGGSSSHHKKKRPLVPGALPPLPPGPSLAERRTKRTRCPNQRIFDDDIETSTGGVGSGNRRRSTGNALYQ